MGNICSRQEELVDKKVQVSESDLKVKVSESDVRVKLSDLDNPPFKEFSFDKNKTIDQLFTEIDNIYNPPRGDDWKYGPGGGYHIESIRINGGKKIKRYDDPILQN